MYLNEAWEIISFLFTFVADARVTAGIWLVHIPALFSSIHRKNRRTVAATLSLYIHIFVAIFCFFHDIILNSILSKPMFIGMFPHVHIHLRTHIASIRSPCLVECFRIRIYEFVILCRRRFGFFIRFEKCKWHLEEWEDYDGKKFEASERKEEEKRSQIEIERTRKSEPEFHAKWIFLNAAFCTNVPRHQNAASWHMPHMKSVRLRSSHWIFCACAPNSLKFIEYQWIRMFYWLAFRIRRFRNDIKSIEIPLKPKKMDASFSFAFITIHHKHRK